MKRFYPALLVMLLTAGMMSQSSPTSPATKDPGTTSPQSQGAPTARQDQPAQANQPANGADNGQSDDPLLAVPPLPKGKVTLVGGTVRSIDQIRNRMTVDTFGGGKMKFVWDERAHIFRDGVETTQLAIKKGDRVYVDSQLVGPKIFAKNIRVVTQLTPADADGQVLGFDARSGEISMRDRLSSQAIRFRVTPDTKIAKENGTAGSQADLRPGTLVNVAFSPDKANRGIAQSVKVLAVPGESFRFSGKITHLDMKSGTLAIANDADNITYDLAIDRASVAGRDELAVGAEVKVVATFQGDNYLAQQITVTQAASKEDKDKDKKDKKDKDKKGDETSEDDNH